jgi:protein O-mannosyl-transferase
MSKNTQKPRAPLVIVSFLAVITVVLFCRVMTFDFIIYDDFAYVTANPQVQAGLSVKNLAWAFTSSNASNWHPLTWLSLMLDSDLFGHDAGMFHLTNLLFHTANTVLLFVLLLRMTKVLWPSAFVAAAFAIHPLHIQSVAWVAERKDVLSTMFWLLTMLFYFRYTERCSASRYVIAIFVFTLGLMAKPMLVTLPVILLLLDYWPLKRNVSLAKLLMEKLPFALLAAASALITLVVQAQSGAMKDVVGFPFDIRVINAFVSYVKYILKMLWPVNLSVFYSHPGHSLHFTDAIIPAVILVIVTGLAIRFYKTHGYLFFGWIWYICTLIPVIGLVQVGDQAMADRYTYVPIIGLFIIIAWGLPELLARFAFRKTILAVAAAVAILAMAVSTYMQLGYWKNSITILSRAVEINPDDRFAQANLGVAFLRKNAYDDAIVHFEKALQIDPCDAMSQLNLGVVLFRKNKLDEAIIHFEKAAAIDPRDVAARLNLATVLSKQGKTQQAIEQCNEILRITPGRPEAIELKRQILSQRQQQ